MSKSRFFFWSQSKQWHVHPHLLAFHALLLFSTPHLGLFTLQLAFLALVRKRRDERDYSMLPRCLCLPTYAFMYLPSAFSASAEGPPSRCKPTPACKSAEQSFRPCLLACLPACLSTLLPSLRLYCSLSFFLTTSELSNLLPHPSNSTLLLPPSLSASQTCNLPCTPASPDSNTPSLSHQPSYPPSTVHVCMPSTPKGAPIHVHCYASGSNAPASSLPVLPCSSHPLCLTPFNQSNTRITLQHLQPYSSSILCAEGENATRGEGREPHIPSPTTTAASGIIAQLLWLRCSTPAACTHELAPHARPLHALLDPLHDQCCLTTQYHPLLEFSILFLLLLGPGILTTERLPLLEQVGLAPRLKENRGPTHATRSKIPPRAVLVPVPEPRPLWGKRNHAVFGRFLISSSPSALLVLFTYSWWVNFYHW